MGRIAYRSVLALLCLYLYNTDSRFWPPCAMLLAWSFFGRHIVGFLHTLDLLGPVAYEHQANSSLLYRFSVEKVLEHPAVDALFEKLQENGKAPAATLAEWRALLLASYAKKYAPATNTCELHFRLKNNLLFLNGKPTFNDYIYEEIVIPYRWLNDEPHEGVSFAHCEYELAIRLFIVNGIVKLQVGRFNKEYSPKILKPDQYFETYETHATITTFPLIYFDNDHGIPVRYLNLVIGATESHKAYRATGSADKKARDRASKNQYRDWKSLHVDVAKYRLLCELGESTYGVDDYLKTAKLFREKREPLLAAERYTTDPRSDEPWRYPDMGQHYWNDYCSVHFQNINADSFKKKERWFTDYYEEQP